MTWVIKGQLHYVTIVVLYKTLLIEHYNYGTEEAIDSIDCISCSPTVSHLEAAQCNHSLTCCH